MFNTNYAANEPPRWSGGETLSNQHSAQWDQVLPAVCLGFTSVLLCFTPHIIFFWSQCIFSCLPSPLEPAVVSLLQYNLQINKYFADSTGVTPLTAVKVESDHHIHPSRDRMGFETVHKPANTVVNHHHYHAMTETTVSHGNATKKYFEQIRPTHQTKQQQKNKTNKKHQTQSSRL